jgi:hypothetical protein
MPSTYNTPIEPQFPSPFVFNRLAQVATPIPTLAPLDTNLLVALLALRPCPQDGEALHGGTRCRLPAKLNRPREPCPIANSKISYKEPGNSFATRKKPTRSIPLRSRPRGPKPYTAFAQASQSSSAPAKRTRRPEGASLGVPGSDPLVRRGARGTLRSRLCLGPFHPSPLVAVCNERT